MFNKEGVCNFCTNEQKIQVLGSDSLKDILNKKKGEKYDCVVPISGGKDSIFVLYYLKKILKKNVIAVNYGSGFQSDLAKENISNTCTKLDVPLIIEKTNFKNHLKLLYEILKISEILGFFYGTCCSCETKINTVSLNTAKKFKVPFIVYGKSKIEEISKPYYINSDIIGRNAVKNQFFQKGINDKIRFIYHFIKHWYYLMKQKNELKVPLKYRIILGDMPYLKGVEHIFFYDYIEWDYIEKISLLEKELDYKYPSNRPHRHDCLLHCFTNYLFLQKTNISSDGLNFASMTRQKKISRDYAQEMEKNILKNIDNDCNKIINLVGLSNYKKPIIRILQKVNE
jgi:hypothetical protein